MRTDSVCSAARVFLLRVFIPVPKKLVLDSVLSIFNKNRAEFLRPAVLLLPLAASDFSVFKIHIGSCSLS